MPNLQPPITRLSALKPRERGTFFAKLAERTSSQTREGLPFYACKFRDARRVAAFMVWADNQFYDACHNNWQAGQLFKIHAVFNDHDKYGPQLDVIKIRPVEPRDEADGFDPADFQDRPKLDPAATLADLRALIEAQIADEPLRRLVLGLIDRHAEKLKAIPAHPRAFYPFPGGWLEHVLSVARTSRWLAERYSERYPDLRPPLNLDVVTAGAVLHDIGRAAELEPVDPDVPTEFTVDGRLFGHLFLGRDMVRDAAREQADLNPELLRLVEHTIVSHLNHPEWGSPRLPLIPEVLILHHADDLDAKMEMYARCLTKDAGPGMFTERDPVLGRQLFKGREV
ncbi:MAG TPA: HD domain-containing protein [Gemmataceae bacterium]|nr:HD domain-containing protein [Gemmataceae bacterium]